MSSRRRSPGLFVGYWFSMDGRRIGRLSRSELAMLYRLRAKHLKFVESQAKA